MQEVKAEKQELHQMRDGLARFALYDDYKTLYDKVVPPVSEFLKEVDKY